MFVEVVQVRVPPCKVARTVQAPSYNLFAVSQSCHKSDQLAFVSYMKSSMGIAITSSQGLKVLGKKLFYTRLRYLSGII